MAGNEFDINGLKVRPGESFTFSLYSRDDYYPLQILTATLIYPNYERIWQTEWRFFVDG